MENILFSLNAVLPIFLIILLGYFLKHFGLINQTFAKRATNIVFKVSLPCMIFQSVSQIQVGELFDNKIRNLAFFSITASVIIFFIALSLALFLVKDNKARGPFVQGIFRSNFVIIGYPLITNLFGEAGLTKAALLTAFIMPVFNVLAVISLTIFLPKKGDRIILPTILKVLKNPLIISVIVALLVAIMPIELPGFLNKTLSYTGQLALPLSLMCIGAFFELSNVKQSFAPALIVTFIKMVMVPIIVVILAYAFGFRGEYLGIIFILFASPTAVSSFAMAEAMDNDSHLAGAIVIMTTAIAVISLFVGVHILKSLMLI